VHAAIWRDLPKNAREYVPVGLGRAVPGAPRFRKVPPDSRPSFCEMPFEQVRNKGRGIQPEDYTVFERGVSVAVPKL